jgi:Protein of unknown function (DUF3103)
MHLENELFILLMQQKQNSHSEKEFKMKHKNSINIGKGLLMSFALLVLAACSNITSPAKNTDDVSAETVNASLETMAKLFAKTMTDANVRQQIQQQVSERFDGDTNVLYKTLVATSSSQAIRQSLAKAQEGFSSQATTLEALASNIPRLQLAVPAHFEGWDAKTYAPLVGYVSAGTNEETLEQIKAFDAEGNEHLLDAQALPEKPVIILSQNERTDEAGALRYTSATESEASSELTAQSCRNVYVRQIIIYNDHEPWYKGDPEIVLRASSNPAGLYFNGGFTNVNDNGVTYTVNRFIGCTPEPSSVAFSWYEDDGPFDTWDVYGSASAYYTLFNGITTWFNLGDLKFSTN